MNICRGLQALVLGAVLVAPLAAQTPAGTLAPCDQGKAENLKLRAQVLELQRALAQLQLERETQRIEQDRQALEATFRALLKPSASEVFNWTTLSFGPAAAPTAGAEKP